ncbi:MAG: response regulator [Clostridia bacterium]|nr:response regulator [Deltaproteobacteria bacterium]
MFGFTDGAIIHDSDSAQDNRLTVRRLTAQGRHLRVLVADDDFDFRETLVAVLKRFGLRVTVVGDGNELIEALSATSNERAPDLVITDNHMPGCTGLGALQIMQNAGLRTPTIVMTGFKDAATQVAAKSLGAVAVLHKPFDIIELKATIHAALV